jgi:hypothetical protein
MKALSLLCVLFALLCSSCTVTVIRVGTFGPCGQPYVPIGGTPIVTGSIGVGGLCTGRPFGGGFIRTHPLPQQWGTVPVGVPVGAPCQNPRIGTWQQAPWHPAPFPQPRCAGPGIGPLVPIGWH